MPLSRVASPGKSNDSEGESCVDKGSKLDGDELPNARLRGSSLHTIPSPIQHRNEGTALQERLSQREDDDTRRRT